jgi:pimeloyl-ACP methyl ester carboxylesterase
MEALRHRTISANGINLHVVEQGDGPAVVLCHGFPESWYSWRHQLKALAGAGYRAIAVDMRGYGSTERPDDIDQYTLLHLVGDLVGVLDALGIGKAAIVGHDWGAPCAWHAALLRPDRFSGVVALSVPFMLRSTRLPTSEFAETDDAMFYLRYFQPPGVAEAEFERDVAQTLRRMLYGFSGDCPPGWPHGRATLAPGMVPRVGGLLSTLGDPSRLPAWLTDADVDFYVAQFASSGFRGALNWYRNIDRNHQLLAPFAGLQIAVPALFIAGERDAVLHFPGMREVLATLGTRVPHLRGKLLLPGCGHWTQQERPDEVNAALLQFLDQLD